MISPVFLLVIIPDLVRDRQKPSYKSRVMLADPGFDGARELRDDPDEFLGFCNVDRPGEILH